MMWIVQGFVSVALVAVMAAAARGVGEIKVTYLRAADAKQEEKTVDNVANVQDALLAKDIFERIDAVRVVDRVVDQSLQIFDANDKNVETTPQLIISEQSSVKSPMMKAPPPGEFLIKNTISAIVVTKSSQSATKSSQSIDQQETNALPAYNYLIYNNYLYGCSGDAYGNLNPISNLQKGINLILLLVFSYKQKLKFSWPVFVMSITLIHTKSRNSLKIPKRFMSTILTTLELLHVTLLPRRLRTPLITIKSLVAKSLSRIPFLRSPMLQLSLRKCLTRLLHFIVILVMPHTLLLLCRHPLQGLPRLFYLFKFHHWPRSNY